MKIVPPAVASGARPAATPTATPSAPVATAAMTASRVRGPAGGAADSAEAKNGMTDEIATLAEPASARWSGSHAP